jgi:molecular chaperone DnaK
MGKTVIDRLRSVSTTDVNSHSLGIKITDPGDRTRKINHIMIPKNTPIPFEKTQRFVTNSDSQQRIHVSVLEGDAPEPDACEQIGDFRGYDGSGRISVAARELTGNTEASTEIVRDNQSVTDENIGGLEGLAKGYEVE